MSATFAASGRGLRRHRRSGFPRQVIRRRASGDDADDLDRRLELPGRRGDAPHERRVAHRDVDRVDVGQLRDDLGADRPGARGNIRIAGVVEKEGAFAASVCVGRIDRGREIDAAFDEARAERADAIGLDRIGVRREKDGRPHAERASGIRHGGAVVAGACRDDLGHVAVGRLRREGVHGAAHLERGGRQLGFELQIDAAIAGAKGVRAHEPGNGEMPRENALRFLNTGERNRHVRPRYFLANENPNCEPAMFVRMS
jgi:hypothetical protein